MLISLLILAAFCWLFISALCLAFKIAWGVAKVVAVILIVLALPAMVLCLVWAAGAVLLFPLVLVAAAWLVLKAIS